MENHFAPRFDSLTSKLENLVENKHFGFRAQFSLKMGENAPIQIFRFTALRILNTFCCLWKFLTATQTHVVEKFGLEDAFYTLCCFKTIETHFSGVKSVCNGKNAKIGFGVDFCVFCRNSEKLCPEPEIFVFNEIFEF